MRRWTSGWALALAACGPLVDVGPGTDADTGATDDSTSSTATTAGPSTTSLDTSASMSVSVGTTVEPTTDEPPPFENGYCAPSCTEPVDCCMGDPSCESMFGTYPYAWGCDAGVCTFGGCADDSECTFGGVLVGYVCTEVDGINGCVPGCDDDQDCEDQALSEWVCNGTYCQPPPCASDEDCGPGSVCDPDSGTCIYSCVGQDACAGFGHCDPDSGACVCSSDDECSEGFGCTPLP